MSTRRNKRRRIDTDLDSIASEQPHSSPLPNHLPTPDDFVHPDSVSPQEAQTEDLDTDPFPKEREIWDAFREEHYERAYQSIPYHPPSSATFPPVLEQLPLSLHRAFTLIQELDEQAQGRSSLIRRPSPPNNTQNTFTTSLPPSSSMSPSAERWPMPHTRRVKEPLPSASTCLLLLPAPWLPIVPSQMAHHPLAKPPPSLPKRRPLTRVAHHHSRQGRFPLSPNLQIRPASF